MSKMKKKNKIEPAATQISGVLLTVKGSDEFINRVLEPDREYETDKKQKTQIKNKKKQRINK
jgi:hypothetical protein